MINPATFGVMPTGLIARSYHRVQHFCVFGSSHFDCYAMFDGRSMFTGTVDYRSICIQ